MCSSCFEVITAYRSPLSTFHMLDDRVIFVGVGGLDCFLADRREIKIGNEPCRFLRVCAEKNISNTNVPMIDTDLTERMETL